MEEGPQTLPPPTLEPISRPSSASTAASASLTQLPGISSLAAMSMATTSPPSRPTGPPPTMYTGASPAATSGGSGGNLPTCQNCSTSTTPLWRRDEFGSVLCNACGLFLKLHGRPRPISLKTDVIKSRNRVKTMRPDLAPKKKQQQQQHQHQQHQQQQQQTQNFSVATDHHGLDLSGQNSTAAHAAQAARRASQRSNGHNDGSDSPISRTGTPSMYNHSLPSFIVDDPSGVGGFGASGNGDGRAASPLNGERHADAPQTHEQLIAQNSSLKTRVSELELINELFRGRLSQIEQQEAAARRGQEVAGVEQNQLRSQLKAAQDSESRLRAQLEDSHRRENNLKRRLDDLELELKDAQDAIEESTIERPAKRLRLDEHIVKNEEVPKPQATPAPPAAVETSEVSKDSQTEAPGASNMVEPLKAAEAAEIDEAVKATEPIEVAASAAA